MKDLNFSIKSSSSPLPFVDDTNSLWKDAHILVAKANILEFLSFF